jgi:DNA repair exonuclease SbcCD ATPase subunit
MILSLHLVNFETHKDSLIEFSPGMNVIRGSTDQGKSTIRRALTYVVFKKRSVEKRLILSKLSSAQFRKRSPE